MELTALVRGSWWAVRVAFQLPTDSEIRYLGAAAEARGYLRRRRGDRLIVADVIRDGDGHVVTCLSPEDHMRRVQRISAALRQAAQQAPRSESPATPHAR